MLHRALSKILTHGLCLFPLLFGSCNKRFDTVAVRETVLSKGQTVEATNRYGTVKISYVDPVTRRYSWDGQEKVVRLIPREEPFQGKLGIYEPANARIFSTGTRLVLEEAVRNFETEEQMQAALIESSDYLDWVYTDDGLVVGFGRTPSRRQVNIDIWQFLLRGHKPAHTPGARPDSIVLKTTP